MIGLGLFRCRPLDQFSAGYIWLYESTGPSTTISKPRRRRSSVVSRYKYLRSSITRESAFEDNDYLFDIKLRRFPLLKPVTTAVHTTISIDACDYCVGWWNRVDRLWTVTAGALWQPTPSVSSGSRES